MDKRSLLGLLIIGVLLFGFSWFNTKKQEDFLKQQAVADSIERAQHPEKFITPERWTDSQPAAETVPVSDSARKAALEANIGPMLVAASEMQEKTWVLENELIRMEVSSLGAKVVSVELKDYKRYDGQPLMMFQEGSAVFDLTFFLKRNFNYAEINTGKFNFTSDQPETITVEEDGSAKTLALRLPVDEGAYLEYRYTISPDNYMVDFDVEFVGMREMLANQGSFQIDWSNVSLQNEKGFDNENTYTTISYRYPGDKSIEDLGMTKAGGEKSKDEKTRIQWVAFKQQFFSTVFVAKNDFENALMSYKTFQPEDGKVKDFKAVLSVPFSQNRTEYDFQFYFGPNKYAILKTYDMGMEKLVPLGGWVVRWINQLVVIPVFDWLGKYVASYGLIILILTFIIKIIILPLTYKSYLSSAKMRCLKPEMDEIAARFPKQEDAMKKQQAVMELYKKAGVNPMGGCLPMLIQFPILIAMFRFFPASIELRGEHFLWADDLSSYDSILQLPFKIPFYGDHVSLFALLMAVAMFIYSKISYAQTAQAGPQMAGMKFMMLYLMPIMLLLWFNNYSSGLCYYYFLSNLITIVQMQGFRYVVNEDKMRIKLKENAKKPRKKSRWQQRYEEMMRQQQQAQRQNAKRK